MFSVIGHFNRILIKYIILNRVITLAFIVYNIDASIKILIYVISCIRNTRKRKPF